MKKRKRNAGSPARARRWKAFALLTVVVVALGLIWDRLGPERRDALRERAAAAAEELTALVRTPPGTADVPPTPVAESAIQEFFGPAQPLNPWGMDDAFVEFLASAQSSLYCACYEWDYAPAAEVLIRQHQAGLRVGLVTDSDYADEAPLEACVEAGVPVVFDKRSALMHNKFCIVDGERIWTGSANITENGFFRNDNNALIIASDALAQNYLREFDEMWRGRRFGARSPQDTPYPEFEVGEIHMECHFAPEDDVEEEILAEILAALHSVDFMAFSFTSVPIAEAMASRIGEGVRVRGVFEGRNAGSRYSRDEYLQERGATVYLDKNSYSMHHKAMVIDGTVVITGSYNFSKSAEEKNDENILIIRDLGLAGKYTAEFERLVR